jgi:hypothetical protein
MVHAALLADRVCVRRAAISAVSGVRIRRIGCVSTVGCGDFAGSGTDDDRSRYPRPETPTHPTDDAVAPSFEPERCTAGPRGGVSVSGAGGAVGRRLRVSGCPTPTSHAQAATAAPDTYASFTDAPGTHVRHGLPRDWKASRSGPIADAAVRGGASAGRRRLPGRLGRSVRRHPPAASGDRRAAHHRHPEEPPALPAAGASHLARERVFSALFVAGARFRSVQRCTHRSCVHSVCNRVRVRDARTLRDRRACTIECGEARLVDSARRGNGGAARPKPPRRNDADRATGGRGREVRPAPRAVAEGRGRATTR